MTPIEQKVKEILNSLRLAIGKTNISIETEKLEDRKIIEALSQIHSAYKEWAREMVGEDRLCQNPPHMYFEDIGYNQAKSEIRERLK